MKISENFEIEELVPPEIFERFKDKSTWFIDQRLVNILEFLRSILKTSITVNNWHTGGQYHESGFRMPTTETGSKLSQHKRGAAVDVKCHGLSVKQVYDVIMAHEKEFMALGLTTMENIESTPTWNHCDVRWTGLDHILIVNP